ncbi:CUE domain-containing protein 1-like isoform X1 [Asterias rubens]|uniref:CUE domain-containing protein 1-like isoform X1 n=1 Tax=Asterias rubens TaxID=7604 RepID=UPI0014556047|nr:CUE domain-containing protein 1-like isoform X1 [Asterias rubens]XP_033628117.1 CUE domain-containing protein 1-like isoform X1 [Asterias rubens]XP_033628118.1 CUE domain-containing protein 1-like isoform X1 [Asterias rubens]
MATAPDMHHPPSGKSKKSKKNRCQSGPPTALMPNNTAMSGAVGGAPGQAATRQLEFHQAMADFKTMFPTMDKDVIETVLRANNGAVDVTIDQLLTLAADMPQQTTEPPQHPQLPQYGDPMNMGFSSPPPGTTPMTPDRGGLPAMVDKPPPYSPPSPNSPFSQEMRKRQLPATPMQSGPPQSSLTQFTPTPSGMAQMPPPSSLFPSRPGAGTPPAAAAVPRHSRWNPPLLGNLPSDFLRVVPAKTTQGASVPHQQQSTMVSADLRQRMEKNVRQRKSIDINDVEMQQMLEDERFALTLQNEEFLTELQRNPEFIAALDNDYSQSVTAAAVPHQFPESSRGSIQASQARPGALPQAGAAGGISADDVEFRNKLSHMGKTTRYKFTQMAKKFNKKKKSSKPQLDGLPAASTMNLLDDYDANGDSALLGTRQEVQENFYSDSKKQKSPKKKVRDFEEPIIFYQEDNEFALHEES